MASKPYVYQSLSEVPNAWRKLRGGRLTLEQINTLTGRAYALGDESGPAYGAAQAEFAEKNTLKNGVWGAGK